MLLLIAAGSMAGQDAGPPKPGSDSKKPATESAKTIEEFKSDAAGYVMKLQGRQDKLTLRDEPLLHWGNPARTGEDGAVFVWMLDGRPEVIGSVFTYRLTNVIRRKHEYHSLSAGPLAAEYRGARVWSPKTAGVTFRPIPDAPAPAETPRLRLTQMKNLARDFSARMVDLEGQQSDLRLIPQPLIRYEPKDKSILDGALFSFSIGTDPEVILLIEARAAGDRMVWHYAAARFHYVNLTVKYKDSEVWHVKALPDMTGLDIGTSKYQDSVYATYHVKTTPIVE